MSIMTTLPVNIFTTCMLLNIFLLSDVWAACPQESSLFVTVPQTMEALSGSCLQIPCSFRVKQDKDFHSSRATVGVWIKEDSRVWIHANNVNSNSSETANTSPMRITGNLSQKNCTTMFYSLTTSDTDTYYFRVENKPFESTASCDPLQITVKDSPWSPTINISGDLKEKESVTITCSAVTPCPHSPPQLTWSLQQDAHSKTEENTDGTFTTKIQETITLSDTHDGDTISCSVTYPVDGGTYKTAEAQETLSVSYPPKDTSLLISPSGSVSVGSVVNLTCSCRANPPTVDFVWFMTSEDRLEMIRVNTQVYGFKVTSRDRDRLFYCGCRNHLDIQLSKGRQLVFEGGERLLIGFPAVLKILGILLLVSTLVIFECCFRSRHSNKSATPSYQMN